MIHPYLLYSNSLKVGVSRHIGTGELDLRAVRMLLADWFAQLARRDEHNAIRWCLVTHNVMGYI